METLLVYPEDKEDFVLIAIGCPNCKHFNMVGDGGVNLNGDNVFIACNECGSQYILCLTTDSFYSLPSTDSCMSEITLSKEEHDILFINMFGSQDVGKVR